MGEDKTRDEIRNLVKQVLDSAAPASGPTGDYPRHVKVNSLNVPTPVKKEFDRDESAKELLTEDDFRGLEPGARIRVHEEYRLTPSASDLVRDRELELIRKPSRGPSIKITTVGVGCDHGGFGLKEELKGWLEGKGIKVRDFGTDSTDDVDYPDYAHAVAESVSDGSVEVGIVIDGAGIGSAMAAGKVPGVRPAACYNVALAKNSRQHNGANVLSLGSGQNTPEEAKEIVYAFITNEITESRHKRRVGKIDAIERQYRRNEQ